MKELMTDIPFTQEQISSMMKFNQCLGDVEELSRDNQTKAPIEEIKHIAFSHYFSATRSQTPSGDFVRDNKMIQIGDEVMAERGLK